MASCIVLANMTPPHFGWGVRAPGLRAEQLAALARRRFEEVRFLLFLERFNLLRKDRGFAVLAPARPDTVIISIAKFADFVDRLAPATFVFTQAEFAAQAQKAATRHTVVYDILAPRHLELQEAGASAHDLATYAEQHRTMVALSRRILVNGPRTLRLFKDDLAGRDALLCNLAPDVPPEAAAPAERSHLVFGGKPQRWTDSGAMFEALAQFLADRDDVPAVMISPPVSEHEPHAAAISELSLSPQVTTLWNLSPLNYGEILGHAFGFVDWSEPNAERVHATSTRALQAVAAGVPVLHQANTALDEMFDDFPGHTVEGALSAADVARFVDDARAGRFDAAVARARAQIAAARDDERIFEGLA